MKKLFDVCEGGKVMDAFFANSPESAEEYVKTVHGEGFLVKEELSFKRKLLSAIIQAYICTEDTDWRGHNEFADLLECTRNEAKSIAYEILYRGCSQYAEVNDTEGDF